MSFTDIFIRRPVLSTVVSAAILVVGLRSFYALQVRAYPKTENGVVTISTSYPGADPESIAGFITTPIETAVAQANGIDYMTSTSQNSTSTITVTLRQNYDTERAAGEINIKVNSVLNQLPSGALAPAISVQVGQTLPAMFLGFYSDDLEPNQITDYLTRVVVPRLQAIDGVQQAQINGGQNFALRAWLDPQKLAGYGLTASDVYTALADNDYISAVGNTKGSMSQVILTSNSNLHTVDEFRNLIVKQIGASNIRLSDVAEVSLGADSYEQLVRFAGRNGVFIAVQLTPSANLLSVVKNVRAAMPQIESQLPQGLQASIAYDSSEFVSSSINEVAVTLIEALLIVMLVIFAFLGSPRSVLIPVIAIPWSLVGTLAIMLSLNFSINLLTLLALVLAIGLVVDDAIIVVENVNRHLEDGMAPIAAAMQAARELSNPIIAMTVVLLAVYIPIGFQGGLTGALFTEFAFTLAGAVTVSAVVALTMSPVLCSRLLHAHRAGEVDWETRLVQFIDRRVERLHQGYRRMLETSLRYTPVTALFVVAILISIVVLYRGARSELAPQEDESFVLGISTYPPDATIQRKLLYGRQAYSRLKQQDGTDLIFQIEAPGSSFIGVTLVPRGKRAHSATDIQQQLQLKGNSLPGQKLVMFQPPSLPGASGLPVQFAIKTTEPAQRLNEVSQAFLNTVNQSGMFMFIDTDLKIDQPQSIIEIDREKAAQIGLTTSQIGASLGALLGGGYVNYFSMQTRSYRVIPQVERRSRLNVDQLLDYPVSAVGGVPVLLSTVASIRSETVPETLNHFQQLNAATLSGVPNIGVTQAEALQYLNDLAHRTLPQGYSVDYGGPLRQFVQESGGIFATFGFAIIIVFLVLAALFESLRDPLVILISVPLSIAGALFFIALFGSFGVNGATLNIYTQVGLVTLIGLISKHGILIVEVANEEQRSGKSKFAAIVAAATLRLRPILMTTAAMVLGVLPLVFATGAGAASRFAIGLVIASGLAVGTLFTLFVVPGVYMLIAATHSSGTMGGARA